jgi:hypothetical protein
MFRRTEIENVLTGFMASIMNLVSQYRQKRDAENQVPFFVNAVEGERARQMKMGLAQVSPKIFTLVSILRASMRRLTRML